MARKPSEILEDENYLITEDEAVCRSKLEEQEASYQHSKDLPFVETDCQSSVPFDPSLPTSIDMFECEMQEATLGNMMVPCSCSCCEHLAMPTEDALPSCLCCQRRKL